MVKHTTYMLLQGSLLALTRESRKVAKHVLGEILLSYYVVLIYLQKLENEEYPEQKSKANIGVLTKKSGKLVRQGET